MSLALSGSPRGVAQGISRIAGELCHVCFNDTLQPYSPPTSLVVCASTVTCGCMGARCPCGERQPQCCACTHAFLRFVYYTLMSTPHHAKRLRLRIWGVPSTPCIPQRIAGPGCDVHGTSSHSSRMHMHHIVHDCSICSFTPASTANILHCPPSPTSSPPLLYVCMPYMPKILLIGVSKHTIVTLPFQPQIQVLLPYVSGIIALLAHAD